MCLFFILLFVKIFSFLVFVYFFEIARWVMDFFVVFDWVSLFFIMLIVRNLIVFW